MSSLEQLFFKWAIYYPAVQLKGSNVFSQLKNLLNTQYFDPSQQRQNQNIALMSTLNKIRKNVKAYRKYPHIHSLDELHKLPIITKTNLLSNNVKDFISDTPIKNLTSKTTGGSTGIPLTIIKTPLARQYYLAAMWRGYSWAGISIGDRRAQFWGTPLTKNRYLQIGDYINRRKRYSAFAFDDNELNKYAQQIAHFKPKFFYGYASMLAEFAEYFERNTLTPPFDILSIISTSEVLTPERRETIERIFNTNVYNEYGCGEIGTIAHECEFGNMHLNTENIIVEIVDDDGNVLPTGSFGNVVVTELYNEYMPLIRYKLGDMGAIHSSKCKCGRHLPIFDGPVGRQMDQLTTSEGKKFNGIYYVYKLIIEARRRNLNIKQYQLIQHSPTVFTFKIVPSKGYGDGKTYKFLQSELKKDFGQNTSIQFEYLNEIPRAKSGKTQIVIGIQNEETAS